MSVSQSLFLEKCRNAIYFFILFYCFFSCFIQEIFLSRKVNMKRYVTIHVSFVFSIIVKIIRHFFSLLLYFSPSWVSKASQISTLPCSLCISTFSLPGFSSKIILCFPGKGYHMVVSCAEPGVITNGVALIKSLNL